MKNWGALLIPAVILTVSPAPGLAQEDEIVPSLADGRQPTEVMVLGVFHFHNPNADYAQFEGIDVLEPHRQRQIEELAAELGRFAPDRIAVERSYDEPDTLNARYQRYLADEFELSRREIHQLGFRLGRQLGHDWIYPIDFRQGMDFDALLGYAAEHEPSYVERFNRYIGEIVGLFNRMQREETIGYNLRFMNLPQNIAPAHAPYAEQAAIGAGDTFVGAEVIAGWYERNLKIFANIAAIAEPGERILVIIGGGHIPILRELIEAHPTMELVEPTDYMGREQQEGD